MQYRVFIAQNPILEALFVDEIFRWLGCANRALSSTKAEPPDIISYEEAHTPATSATMRSDFTGA